MKANKTINLSTKTNLLEQDLYEYKLQDVSQPELFREIFPYNEVPKVSSPSGRPKWHCSPD